MIKKIFLILTIFALTNTLSLAADRIPSSSKSIRHYGIGVLKLQEDFCIFAKPDEKSKNIQKFILPVPQQSAIIKETQKTVNPYIVSIPKKHEFYAAVSEYPEEDWIEIYFNQNGKETGWTKISDKSDFLTWKEFVYKYGKKNGLTLMKDVPDSEFRLYSQDNEDSQIVDEFTYPQYISLRMIRGNWMLITVVDSGNIYKTGWFRWRTDDGKLRVFPKMK